GLPHEEPQLHQDLLAFSSCRSWMRCRAQERAIHLRARDSKRNHARRTACWLLAGCATRLVIQGPAAAPGRSAVLHARALLPRTQTQARILASQGERGD